MSVGKVAEILDTAVDVMHERGWAQDHPAFRRNRDEVCSHEALAAASVQLLGDGCVSFPAAVDALQREVGDLITTWNDDPGRSFEDVVLAFKRAAETARTEGDA